MRSPGLAAWLGALWLAVIFTPTVRLGAVPVRLDDLLVFGTFALFLVGGARSGTLPRTGAAAAILFATAGYILGVTIWGPPLADLSVGPREYLDVARPLKFAAVLWMTAQVDPDQGRVALARWFPAAILALLIFSAAQVFLLVPWSQGWLANLSLAMTELEDWHARSMFGQRGFATFHTPTDLGYVASIVAVCGLLWSDAPRRRWVVLGALAVVALSGTRTFLFSLPLMLLLYALLTSGSAVRALQRLGVAAILVVVGVVLTVYLLPEFRENVQFTLQSLMSGDLRTDQSIVHRLRNFHLVEITMGLAPVTGVISRDFFTRGVDSEYIITIHRYGLAGLALTLLFYAATSAVAWRLRRLDPDLSTLTILVLALTFIYGITQGALISTRVGVLPMIFVGLAYARAVRGQPRSGAAPRPGARRPLMARAA